LEIISFKTVKKQKCHSISEKYLFLLSTPAHMKTTLSWKRGVFSSTCRIFSGEANYYQQAMIAIMVAVFIPIWVSVIN